MRGYLGSSHPGHSTAARMHGDSLRVFSCFDSDSLDAWGPVASIRGRFLD